MSSITESSASQFAHLPSRLEAARLSIAARFPRPAESIVLDQSEDIGHLLETVQKTRTAAEVVQMAKHLSARTVQLIFPALALPGSADLPAKSIDKLLIILRERACPSLYPRAWIIWQQHYPNPLLTKALSIVCGILEIKKAGSKPPVHGHIPLISSIVELHGPSISRRLVMHLVQKQAGLQEHLTQYSIHPEWPFGRSLLAEAFIAGNADMFAEQISKLELVFQAVSAEKRARIMHHFLSLDALSEPVKQQAHVVFYQNCGEPSSASPVWSLLNKRDRRVFANWVNRARIGSHCLNHPEKALFYLRFADHIKRVEPWDEQTLLIYFDSFVIADDNRYPEQALFYSGQEPNPHPGGMANPDHTANPASPAIAHRRLETAIQQGDLTGIIQLLFDPEGIKQSGVLLDFALQKKGRRLFFGI